MGSYYYLEDSGSEFEFFPVPEGDYLQAVFGVAKRYGVKITDKEILQELRIKKRLKQAPGRRKGETSFLRIVMKF